MTVLEHWFNEVWNNRNAAAIDHLWPADKITHGLPNPHGGHVETREAFKGFHRDFLSAFPDFHVQVEDTVTEGNKTAVRVTVTGTHKGNGLPMPPTGKPVRFSGMCIATLKDGIIVEAWNNFDFLSMYKQLE
jgi:steroid delta-isomerase-like uncharacterized protein